MVQVAPPAAPPPATSAWHEATTPPLAAQSAAPGPMKRAPQRTMLGLPSEMLAQAGPPAPAPAPAPAKPQKPSPARTMLGLPALALPEAPQAPTAVPPRSAPAPAAPPKAVSPNRTMLGMPASALAQAAQPPQGQTGQPPQGQRDSSSGRDSSPLNPRTRRKSRPEMGLTMVEGVPPTGPEPVAEDQRPGRARASANYGMVPIPPPPSQDSSDNLPALPKSKAPLYIGIATAILLVIGAVVALTVWLVSGGPEVTAVVAQTDAGEVLQLTLPDVAPGSRVQLGGREAVVEAGHATLPLASDALHVGPNELSLVVVGPDGSSDTVPLTLLVAYRVRADLSALEQRPPVLRYLVEAQPGSSVALDGRPVTLDAAGTGHHDYPVVASADDQGVERIVRYEVRTAAGAAETGQITTRIPYAALTVDRPGDEFITDQSVVEVAGSVAAGATVMLDGTALALHDGRFLQRVPTAEVREYRLQLLVRQPGFAPRHREIVVRRVADLAAEAARYPVDAALTYARIAQNPAIYRGQSVALEGRVYHVDVHEGRSVLQMMVRECAGGQRCALWVTYPAATDATVGAWVRVIGDVAGEQAFQPRSGGATMTVPRVDARFVLPVR